VWHIAALLFKYYSNFPFLPTLCFRSFFRQTTHPRVSPVHLCRICNARSVVDPLFYFPFYAFFQLLSPAMGLTGFTDKAELRRRKGWVVPRLLPLVNGPNPLCRLFQAHGLTLFCSSSRPSLSALVERGSWIAPFLLRCPEVPSKFFRALALFPDVYP